MNNRKYTKISAIILAIMFMIVGCSSKEVVITAEDASTYGIIETNLSTEEKLEDFEYMYTLIAENYPFLNVNKRLNGIDWLKNKNKYKKMIKNTKNDAEFFVAIDQILGDLNNPHTHVFSGEVYKRYYKHFYPFEHEVLNYEKSMERYGFDGNVDNIELNPNSNFLISDDEVLKTNIIKENEVDVSI